ncbi:hypothetical protein HNY73_017420 [Argiope bruennichi]|uniref:Double jelly roll-like domain-containing protein n=1 Tax=Argiope bruennichi TaxID=94029 RepID=A0A8T0EAN2_ARGBR|nr:hypothetical protein HNY73_017420 [Argiope bruennichi]
MNALQKERNKKLREEVKNDLKVFKLQAEIRRNNEQKLEQELGFEKSLSDFHKPVTEKLQEQELSRKEHFKAITDAVASIPLSTPPAIEPSNTIELFNFDRELDVDYLEKNNFPRPSKLYYETTESLREIVDRDEEREDRLLAKVDYLTDHMNTLLDYRDRLRDLQRKEKYTGKGIEDKLEILSRFTDMLLDGSKSKKLRSQVADLLDVLLREGTMTKEQIAKLKSAFRKGEEVSLQIDKTKAPNYDMHLTPTQVAQIGKGKRITISKTQLKKTGGFLPFLAPFIPALIAGAKALALGAASGAAGWGAKKALEKMSGSGCKKKPHGKGGFRGVFTSDLLPKKMRRFESGIINLDIATEPGTHWVCYYNDPNNTFVEYFDPFGEYVYKLLPNIKKYLQSSGKTIGYNSSFLQHPTSVKCGYFCMKYISERNKDSKNAEKSEDFTIEYARPFNFKKIALQSFSMYVSWENIKDEEITYYDGQQWSNLSIPDGNYTIKGLNRYMVSFFGEDPPILFGIVEERQRTAINLKDQYKIDLTKCKTLHKLLGFEPKVYEDPEKIGKFIADLSGGNDNIYIHCDIAEGAYINGSHTSNVIFSFTNVNRPGSQIIKSFDRPLFFPVRMDSVNRIRMRITNHRGELIPLNKQENSDNSMENATYHFFIQDTNANILYSNGYLQQKLKIVYGDGTAITDDNVALVNGGGLINANRLTLGTTEIESNINYSALMRQVLGLVHFTPDYSSSEATNMFFYVDTADTADRKPLKHFGTLTDNTKLTEFFKNLSTNEKYNYGFTERRKFTKNSQVVTIWVPLKYVFDFFSEYKKVITGLQVKFEFQRNDSRNMVYTDELNKDYKVIVEDLSLWLPYVKFKNAAAAKFNELRLSDKNVEINWNQHSIVKSNIFMKNSSGCYTIKATSDEVLSLYVIPQYTDRYENVKQNNMLFDNLDMIECYLMINNIKVPTVSYMMDFERGDYNRLYASLLESGLNTITSETGCMVNYSNFEMTAYYPLFEEEIKQGSPGIPGIGFKLTNDGNYDMESKLLKNVSHPLEGDDSSTKKYVDDLKKSCLIRTNGYFNAKRKLIRNVEDPAEESDASTKRYVDQLRDKTFMHDGESFNAKNMFVSNVKWPKKELDAVNKQCLAYSCILWDKDKRIYFAHDERISNVKAPQNDSDCANKYYVDTKTFCATTARAVDFTGVGFRSFQFNEFSSKLLDSNLKLSQNMFMKITIFLACDKMVERPLIRLEKMKEVLIDRAISVNEETITMFAYGKLNDVLTLSVLSAGGCKLKPYLHIEKIEFSLKT